MSIDAERFYRGVLRVYPASYRAASEGEMLAVLMESTRAGKSPSFGETIALVRHGLAQRFFGGSKPATWRQPSGAVVVCLSALLAVFSVAEAAEVAGGVLHFDPAYSPTSDSIDINPLWPVYLLWLAIFGMVLWRKGVVAAVLAWLAVLAHLATLVGLNPTGGAMYGFGKPDPLMVPSPAAAFEDMAHVVPGLVLALLLLSPGCVHRGVDLVTRRTALTIVAVGSIPAIGDGLLGWGISAMWAILFGLAVAVMALGRAQVLLRGGLLLTLPFSYFLLIAEADGSGSRLPHGPVALPVTLGLIPLAVAAVLVLVIRHVESYGLLRKLVVRGLETLTRMARGPLPPAEADKAQVEAD